MAVGVLPVTLVRSWFICHQCQDGVSRPRGRGKASGNICLGGVCLLCLLWLLCSYLFSRLEPFLLHLLFMLLVFLT